MRFLLQLIACGGSCYSSEKPQPPEEKTTLLVPPPRRRPVRRHGRLRGGCRGWRPSLSSISEDVLLVEMMPERPVAPSWRRKLKRKVSSINCSRLPDHEPNRQALKVSMPPYGIGYCTMPLMF